MGKMKITIERDEEILDLKQSFEGKIPINILGREYIVVTYNILSCDFNNLLHKSTYKVVYELEELIDIRYADNEIEKYDYKRALAKAMEYFRL